MQIKRRKDGSTDNYFVPPHGGRPPSDEAVRAATERYVREEAEGKLRDLPVSKSYQ